MRYWVLKKMYQDVSFTSVECTNAEIRMMLVQKKFLKAQASSSSDDIAKQTALKYFASWRKFKEGWEGYISQVYNAMVVPLTIILRAHTLVKPDMLSEIYSSTDIEYMHTFKLERGGVI